ncbi:unnamed protein product, partial [Ectocarpus sp. 13 AM-2016]
MEAGLDAVEEDVERKRVGKNPFDQKFTALTESPFTETSTSTGGIESGGHEIETISRHIIVRMEVIAKQIAFLSKETAGQPHKVLAGGGRVGTSSSSASSADGQQRNVSAEGAEYRPLGTSAVNADIGGRSGHNKAGTGVASGDSSSPFGAPLVARLDLFRRIRQGLATAAELLPAGMLSAAPLGMASSPPTPLQTTVTSLTSDGLACPTAPGILHGFIKHVKPFSVCYASAAQANGPPKENDGGIRTNANSMGTFAEDEGRDDGISDGGGGGDDDDDDDGSGTAANFCDYGDDMPCSPCEATIGQATPNSSAGRSPSTTMAAAAVAAGAGGGLTHTRAEKDGDNNRGSRSSEQGVEQERKHGAPRKPALPPAGGVEALRRAKARLQGKRQLSYPGFSSPITENPITRPGYHEQEVGKDGDIAEGGRRDGGAMSAAGGGGGGGGSSALHSSLRGTNASTRSAAATAAAAAAAAARLRTSNGVAGTRGVGSSSRRKNNGNNGSTSNSNSRSNSNSNNGENERATGKKRRGTEVGGVHGGRNGGGGGAEPDWSALSWGSAKQLRKKMEAAATAA